MIFSTNGTCGTSTVLHNDLHLMNLYHPFLKDERSCTTHLMNLCHPFLKDDHNFVDGLNPNLNLNHLDCSLLDLDFRTVVICLHDRDDFNQLCR